MKIALAVLSCDKYADLWDPFFTLFFRHWENCPFEVLLFSNEKTYNHPKVRTILSGPDSSWSGSVKSCLKQIDCDYIFLFFDDVLLNKDVNSAEIQILIEKLRKYQPEYLRFRPIPIPDERVDKEIGRYNEDTLYRTAIFSIWKKNILESLLVDGESAWDLETIGASRSAQYKKFYGVYKEYFSYWHGVEKGTWDSDVVLKLQKAGVKVDTKLRRSKTAIEMKTWKRARMKEAIFNSSPSFVRPYLLKCSKVLRKIIS